jgi:hypothetical protein
VAHDDPPDDGPPLERNPAKIGLGAAMIAVVLVGAGALAVVVDEPIVSLFAVVLVVLGVYRVTKLVSALRGAE